MEIVVKSVDQKKSGLSGEASKHLLQIVKDNRQNAPVVSPDLDIRELIDSM